ncbi:hypothetical protein UVI_02033780 [Ustilaginoidea virens]|uniref:Uncharacterized protein n=1 Tax=Ustilaginoidea virens TaxID=1159556 RepID=A0A1B5KTM8_USTVR|nr:hypothetical protein UVI_02033780 [Ustilaginoidea virens]
MDKSSAAMGSTGVVDQPSNNLTFNTAVKQRNDWKPDVKAVIVDKLGCAVTSCVSRRIAVSSAPEGHIINTTLEFQVTQEQPAGPESHTAASPQWKPRSNDADTCIVIDECPGFTTSSPRTIDAFTDAAEADGHSRSEGQSPLVIVTAPALTSTTPSPAHGGSNADEMP